MGLHKEMKTVRNGKPLSIEKILKNLQNISLNYKSEFDKVTGYMVNI